MGSTRRTRAWKKEKRQQKCCLVRGSERQRRRHKRSPDAIEFATLHRSYQKLRMMSRDFEKMCGKETAAGGPAIRAPPPAHFLIRPPFGGVFWQKKGPDFAIYLIRRIFGGWFAHSCGLFAAFSAVGLRITAACLPRFAAYFGAVLSHSMGERSAEETV